MKNRRKKKHSYGNVMNFKTFQATQFIAEEFLEVIYK